MHVLIIILLRRVCILSYPASINFVIMHACAILSKASNDISASLKNSHAWHGIQYIYVYQVQSKGLIMVPLTVATNYRLTVKHLSVHQFSYFMQYNNVLEHYLRHAHCAFQYSMIFICIPYKNIHELTMVYTTSHYQISQARGC